MTKKRGFVKHARRKKRPGEDVDPQQAAAFEAKFSDPSVERPEVPLSKRPRREVVGREIQRGSKKRRSSGGERFVVTLPKGVAQKIRVAAAADGRSLGNVVEVAVTHWLESGRPDPLSYDID